MIVGKGRTIKGAKGKKTMKKILIYESEEYNNKAIRFRLDFSDNKEFNNELKENNLLTLLNVDNEPIFQCNYENNNYYIQEIEIEIEAYQDNDILGFVRLYVNSTYIGIFTRVKDILFNGKKLVENGFLTNYCNSIKYYN